MSSTHRVCSLQGQSHQEQTLTAHLVSDKKRNKHVNFVQKLLDFGQEDLKKKTLC
jgi:hypothetical protein